MVTGYCDFHSHFLPGMDDGCKTPEEAVRLLEEDFRQGVGCVLATPHYYPVEPVAEFLERRAAAAQRLQAYLDSRQTQIPEIALGAEVAFRPGLGYEQDLEKLCLGSSRYLLLEMPFSKWSTSQIRDVSNICTAQGIIPVIAHIERYIGYQTPQILEQLQQQDVLIQMNAEYLLHFGSRRKGLKMLKNGTVHLLGTDSHNTTSRPPNLGKAIEFLRGKGALDTLEKQRFLADEIFSA